MGHNVENKTRHNREKISMENENIKKSIFNLIDNAFSLEDDIE